MFALSLVLWLSLTFLIKLIFYGSEDIEGFTALKSSNTLVRQMDFLDVPGFQPKKSDEEEGRIEEGNPDTPVNFSGVKQVNYTVNNSFKNLINIQTSELNGTPKRIELEIESPGKF